MTAACHTNREGVGVEAVMSSATDGNRAPIDALPPGALARLRAITWFTDLRDLDA